MVEEGKSSWKTRVTQGPCPGFGHSVCNMSLQGSAHVFTKRQTGPHVKKLWVCAWAPLLPPLGPWVIASVICAKGEWQLFAGPAGVIVCSFHQHMFSQSGEIQIVLTIWSLETNHRFHLGLNGRRSDWFQRWRKKLTGSSWR